MTNLRDYLRDLIFDYNTKLIAINPDVEVPKKEEVEELIEEYIEYIKGRLIG